MIDLRHGDCLEVLKDIPDKSIDLVVSDPPYKFENKVGDFMQKTKVLKEYILIV